MFDKCKKYMMPFEKQLLKMYGNWPPCIWIFLNNASQRQKKNLKKKFDLQKHTHIHTKLRDISLNRDTF